MSRLHIGRFNGTDVWEGPCEGCVTVTRIVYDESAGRYLCSSCLSRKDLAESGIGSYRGSNQSFPMTIDGKSNGKLPVEIMVNS